jgi:hypothetical protein
MPSFPHRPGGGLPQRIILLEVAALFVGLSAVALSWLPVTVWLAGVVLITLHTLLFYRLGKIAGRLSVQKLPDFFRGFKQGLLGRSD